MGKNVVLLNSKKPAVSENSNLDLAENITALNENLSASIDQLTTTLSSLLEPAGSFTSTQLIFAIFIAFIGAFSAYLFNLFHWSMVEKKKKISNMGLSLDFLIKDLESIAVDYWVQDFEKKSLKKMHASEISIKSNIRLISKYIVLLIPKLNTKDTAIKQKFNEFSLEIFDIATGDDFESKNRKASKSKAAKIAFRCSDIRALISTLEF